MATGAQAGAFGFLESPDSPYLARNVFGYDASSPLIVANEPSGGLEGGLNMPAVQTVPSSSTAGPHDAGALQSWRNLLRPSHSPAFWLLVFAVLALGLFSASGKVKVGPVKLGGAV